MTGGRAHRVQPLIIGVLLIGGFGGRCSEPDKFELTVRLRESFDWAAPPAHCFLNLAVLASTAESPYGAAQLCFFAAGDHVWRGDDGSRAAVTTQAVTIYVTEATSSTVECAGRAVRGAWWVRLHPDTPRDEIEFKVETEDGTLELEPETGLWATTPRETDRCMEMSGTWRGVEGTLLNRTGTYTMMDDSIQTVLELVEQ
jgi:hypothetical protein